MNSCYNCKERKLGCHSNCKAYKKQRERYDLIRKNKIKDRDILGHIVDSINRFSGRTVGIK